MNTIFPIKGHAATQQHKRNNTERPHICFFIVIARQEFWGHGVHGPHLIMQDFIRSVFFGKAKINDFYHVRVRRTKHDVFKFELMGKSGEEKKVSLRKKQRQSDSTHDNGIQMTSI